MGDEVEDMLVVVDDEANGQWELQGSMGCDELGDMGCLVPMT
jgi:hypothetical protein